MKEMDMYKVVNGTSYHKETPDKVVDILERARQNKTRIRVFYGSVEFGSDWLEENDTIGTVERSTGTIKVPLLVRNSRGIGGGSILDNCIVKITIDKEVVYQVENYQEPDFEIVKDDAENMYKVIDSSLSDEWFLYRGTREKAQRYIDFMLGLRNSK